LYDPKLDGAGGDIQGAGATHAWADVYIPGAGWVEYDPTNGLIAGENLIRVAVTRDASQAVPISGSYTGGLGDFLGMTVDVNVTSSGQLPAA
jgi:transglutaminase-like putative cysteine protease